MIMGMAVPAFAAADDYTYTHVKGSSWNYGWHYFHDGYCPVMTDDGWRYTDENGNIVDFGKGNFMYVFDFSEGYAAFVNNDFKLGYIDTKGKVVIPAQYDPYDEGMGSLYAGRVVNGNILVYDADTDEFSQINLKNKKVTKTLDPWDDSVRALISDSYGNKEGAVYITDDFGDGEDEIAFTEGKALIRCDEGMCIVSKKSAGSGNSGNSGSTDSTAAVKSFSDVPAKRWSHNAIMEMVGTGLFKGTTTPDKNGIAKFDPEGTMTVAQFVTVIERILWQEELADYTEAYGQGDYWYSANYDFALENGLFMRVEFSIDDMNRGITREEMAFFAIKAVKAKGEKYGPFSNADYLIADYNTISNQYAATVQDAYMLGILTGVDSKGTFAPDETLTREQGAMVAYRILNEDARVLPA